ncbi:MAG: sensor histidine kinase [Microcoleaceae cyanobacterium]
MLVNPTQVNQQDVIAYLVLREEREQLLRENIHLKTLLRQQDHLPSSLVPPSLGESSSPIAPTQSFGEYPCSHCNLGHVFLESALQKALEAALVASEAKRSFLAKMSHELRTPLHAIVGYADILQEEAIAQGLVDSLPDIQIIQQESQHLLCLINDILDLTKLEAGQMQVNKTTFDPVTLVEALLTQLYPKAQRHQNHLCVSYGENLGLVHTDPAKLRQILLNLLDNALKFTRGGEITLRISRQVSEGVNWICCQVTDTGIGISAEHQQMLFEEFSQVDSSMTRQYEGTGLGLAICSHLCEILDGNIHISSQLGVGSTFTVNLKTDC